MSLSINPYSNTSAYAAARSADSQPAAEKYASLGQSGKETSKTADSLQLSPEYLAYLVNQQNVSTTSIYDAYSIDNIDEPLTIEEKKSILTELQSKINSYLDSYATTSKDASGPLSEVISKLEDALSSFDGSKASDKEVTSLFEEVAQTVAEARPPRPEGPPPGDGPEGHGDARGPAGANGTDGGIPPLIWELLSEYAEDDKDETVTAVSSALEDVTGTDENPASDSSGIE